ncbi:isochorismatase family protein [Aliikangiella coralliicola]|uniref:Isochorismatase family protein n=1 Tax=Aliikangiella coralliicola TaxID=2592383 RepID=A0A545UC91_9GAMM|nr:isochorismatase family protein [Aliikangiella coralliicola]TQV87080.1 isochorismatase family protein [Aliikangiella coralliicola]
MKKIFFLIPLTLLLSACEWVDDLQLASETKVSEQVQFKTDNTGLLIIDSQKSYVMDSEEFWVNIWYPDLEVPPENIDPQLHNNIERIAQLAQSANDLDFPTTITYEAYNTEWGLEYSPYIESIKQALDENTQSFFKQSFNSTLEDGISSAMQAWLDAGINRIVVAGAETDVCVMQTALGLKKMGFDVYLASDATFSTEIYERATFKRLQQAGVKLATTNEIIESMSTDDELVYSPRYAVGQRDDLHQGDRHQMAMVNFNMDDGNLARAVHDNKAAIKPRLISLGLEQEFLFSKLPSFHLNAKGKAYTSQYRKNADLISYEVLEDVIADMQAKNKSQAVISGVVSQLELLDAVSKFTEAGITPIILEDALMGEDVDPVHYLDYAYQLGAVPSSQKSNGYEMYVEVQLGDFTEEEKAAYWQMIELGEGLIPEVYPRLR